MFGGIGVPELIIVLLIVLLVFGAGKLPEIGNGLGKAIKNFKKASKDKNEVLEEFGKEEKKEETTEDKKDK
jgi:sec-independent protein translocase protein TatA